MINDQWSMTQDGSKFHNSKGVAVPERALVVKWFPGMFFRTFPDTGRGWWFLLRLRRVLLFHRIRVGATIGSEAPSDVTRRSTGASFAQSSPGHTPLTHCETPSRPGDCRVRSGTAKTRMIQWRDDPREGLLLAVVAIDTHDHLRAFSELPGQVSTPRGRQIMRENALKLFPRLKDLLWATARTRSRNQTEESNAPRGR